MVGIDPEEAGRHARLRRAIDDHVATLTRELDALLPSPLPAPARVNRIVNSLAWHERRPGPAARVAALGRELARLRDKDDTPAGEVRLYETLRRQLDPARTHDAWRDTTLERLDPAPAEHAFWAAELDLRWAETAVHVLRVLTRIERPRAEIERDGGKVVLT